jgi:hypothetical protein
MTVGQILSGNPWRFNSFGTANTGPMPISSGSQGSGRQATKMSDKPRTGGILRIPAQVAAEEKERAAQVAMIAVKVMTHRSATEHQ